MRRILPGRSGWAAALALLAAGCRNVPDPAFTQLLEARRLAADLHVQFIKASNASDRAVLADTDEASVEFAKQAQAATQSVRTGIAELGSTLQRLGYADESSLLDEFSRRFDDYAKVDKDVLALAVENTNLKAQRLSFGPVREAADAFRDALDAVVKAAPARERVRVEAQTERALLAVREIQVLQAPHIAEADDAAMSRLEKEMSGRQAAARDALKALSGVAPQETLDAAGAALDRFDKLSADLVSLSRRNTNVKSLALSLKPKPALTAACDASLGALEESLAKRGFAGTR
ncbi:MAG TPA: hypothetical protein VHL80_06360 [Polyangia bacterium]|nr:hypothetical protein [Polyangia bacterium]